MRSEVEAAITGAGGTVMGASISEAGIEVSVESSRRKRLERAVFVKGFMQCQKN